MPLYSFRCVTDGCHYTRSYGAAKIRCEVEAARHHRRFPHHRITLIKSEVYAIFGENTIPLPLSDGPPY